jgi:hypothetical protein
MIMHSGQKEGVYGKVVQDEYAKHLGCCQEEPRLPVLPTGAFTEPAWLSERNNRQPVGWQANESNQPTGPCVRVLLF